MRLADLGELQTGSGRGIQLVVKNSFFELVEAVSSPLGPSQLSPTMSKNYYQEESPREMRRARSCDAVLTLGLVEQALQARSK